jgi:D-alanyl-D-alanine carboxypeptidase
MTSRFTSLSVVVLAGCLLAVACSNDAATPPTSTTSTTSTAIPASSVPAPGPDAVSAAAPPDGDTDQVTRQIQEALDRDAARFPSSPGQILTVRAPGIGLDLTLATGGASPDSTFRIASITKTFTAATVLRLVEQGRIDLDATLESVGVPDAMLDVLRDDGYLLDAITVRQLLVHTSGIADYADNDTGAGSGPYSEAVLADPSHRWTPLEQIRFATDHHDPVSEPGAEFHYSDTGYVLLGQIIESATGSTYAEAMRTLLRFDSIGLEATWLESVEPVPTTAGQRASQYLGDVDISVIDPSVDLYGGGGLVSSTADLATFFRALGRGEVFDQPDTFQLMTSIVAPDTGGAAAAGVYRSAINDVPCWLHDGFWGTMAITCPAIDLTITRSYQQADPDDAWDPNDLLLSVVRELGFDQRSAAAGAQAATSEALLAHSVELVAAGCVAGLPADARCGSAVVPLDWTDPEGETIEIWWAVQPATTQPAVGTIIPLLGGPGGAISTAIDAFVPIGSALPDRDVLFVDVRGVGRSSRLSCEAIDRPETLFGTELVTANARCAEELGVRRDSFTTVATVLDIEAIRRELGLGNPSLLSFSYGTFLATTYATLMPDVVEAAVLDGAFPLETDPWGLDVVHGISRVAGLLCERSGRCDGRALLDQITDVAEDLHTTPHTYDGLDQPLTEGLFASLTQVALAAGSTTYLDGVAAAVSGDYSVLETLVTGFVTGGGLSIDPLGDSYPLGTTVWCNDYVYPYDMAATPDQRRVSLEQALERMPDDVFAPFSKQGWLAANWDHPDECLDWPTPQIPTELRIPRFGPFPDMPILVINGDVDLQTPIDNARVVASRFPNSVLMEIENGPHAVIPESPCVLGVAIAFLTTTALPAPDACSEEHLPPPSS